MFVCCFLVAFVCFVFNSKHLRYLSLFVKRIVIISFIKSIIKDIFIHQEKRVTSHEVWSCDVFRWRRSSRVQVCVIFY